MTRPAIPSDNNVQLLAPVCQEDTANPAVPGNEEEVSLSGVAYAPKRIGDLVSQCMQAALVGYKMVTCKTRAFLGNEGCKVASPLKRIIRAALVYNGDHW